MLLSESGLWMPLKSDESMAELRISWFPNWYEIRIMNLKWWKVTDLVKKWKNSLMRGKHDLIVYFQVYFHNAKLLIQQALNTKLNICKQNL